MKKSEQELHNVQLMSHTPEDDILNSHSLIHYLSITKPMYFMRQRTCGKIASDSVIKHYIIMPMHQEV